MPEDLPIYSNTMLRTGLQFADLANFKDLNLNEVWSKSDELLAGLEGASNVAAARSAIQDSTKKELLKVHSLLFQGRPGAGLMRSLALPAIYRGQDCAPPQFIERSLDNLEIWLAADSFKEIHPIERCALTLTRIVDIWPFEFGNFTTSIVFANKALYDAGLAPFFVLPKHLAEFEKVVMSSMIIEMQPLINAIYQTIKREMTQLGK